MTRFITSLLMFLAALVLLLLAKIEHSLIFAALGLLQCYLAVSYLQH